MLWNVAPATRLAGLVQGLNAQRLHPHVEGTLIDACPLLERKDAQGLVPLANRILELVAR